MIEKKEISIAPQTQPPRNLRRHWHTSLITIATKISIIVARLRHNVRINALICPRCHLCHLVTMSHTEVTSAICQPTLQSTLLTKLTVALLPQAASANVVPHLINRRYAGPIVDVPLRKLPQCLPQTCENLKVPPRQWCTSLESISKDSPYHS